jgi:hypothetical protein
MKIVTHDSLRISNKPFILKDINQNDKVLMKMLDDKVDLYKIKLYQDSQNNNKKKLISLFKDL